MAALQWEVCTQHLGVMPTDCYRDSQVGGSQRAVGGLTASQGRQQKILCFSSVCLPTSLICHCDGSLEKATGPSSCHTCGWTDPHLLPSPSISSFRKVILAHSQSCCLLSHHSSPADNSIGTSHVLLPPPQSSLSLLGAQMYGSLWIPQVSWYAVKSCYFSVIDA